MGDASLLYWLFLFHTPGLTASVLSRLVRHFGSPEAILAADCEQLCALGLSTSLAIALLDSASSQSAAVDDAMADLDWAGKAGNSIVTLTDPAFPPLLRQIDCPPPLLYVSGQTSALQIPQIAIVGSRNCSVYGRETASSLAGELANAGMSICSGLATGIDTAAHAAAVRQQKISVAVLGNGLDTCYPPANEALAKAMCERGALVSEFKRSTKPLPELFPQRNRIISGMSVGVIVVEAALRSGSLITARLAMEQNREVFAVPGSIKSPHSKGCHRLIREGAVLIENAEEVIAAAASLLRYQFSHAHSFTAAPDCEAAVGLTEEEQELLKQLDYDPVSVDSLLKRTGLALQSMNALLLHLELKGLVRVEAGGYVRC